MEEEQSYFELDPTVPWGTLPYFIKHCIYWRAMVHARNEMGWKTLHEQLFPLEYGKQTCWDCGHGMYKTSKIEHYYVIVGTFDLADKYCQCHRCGLSAQRTLYRVQKSHSKMYIRNNELPIYKMYVFGYLVYNLLSGFSVFDWERNLSSALLTGYHVTHGTNGNKVMVRYYDEDSDYTHQHHTFRPLFLGYEHRTSFA